LATGIDLLDPDEHERLQLWEQLKTISETYRSQVETYPVRKLLSPADAARLLTEFNFEAPLAPSDVLAFTSHALTDHSFHFAHPRCFSRFNPATTTLGAIADALVAVFNPQLASWRGGPFPIAVERHLIKAFGMKFGYPEGDIDGTFTSGGSEANHTGILAALNDKFPEFSQSGLRSLPGSPVLFVSSEAHHSFRKAARACGLGNSAVIEVPVDADLRMDLQSLRALVLQQRKKGALPFLVVGTIGTTSAGVIDPLPELATFAKEENLWFHVDGAWGGSAILIPEMIAALSGVEHSDSLTLDAHKWLSVPMGAGLFLTRHKEILRRSFHVSADYMPKCLEDEGEVEHYTRSLQWSRRFVGLKVFMNLASVGWNGYAAALRHQVATANHMRELLLQSDWKIENKTVLPLVCFTNGLNGYPKNDDLAHFIDRVVEEGHAFLSVTAVRGHPAARACVTNYRTSEDNVREFVDVLNRHRKEGSKGI
jgi:glutamate/tyrosine decarboxylase-like PLP-dependent enzyme